jgi:hypothetical protein
LHYDFIRQGNFDHNHFEGEIALHRDAWITFAKMVVCEGGKCWHWAKVQKGFWIR